MTPCGNPSRYPSVTVAFTVAFLEGGSGFGKMHRSSSISPSSWTLPGGPLGVETNHKSFPLFVVFFKNMSKHSLNVHVAYILFYTYIFLIINICHIYIYV